MKDTSTELDRDLEPFPTLGNPFMAGPLREEGGGGELENHLNRSEWYRAPRISGSTAE